MCSSLGVSTISSVLVPNATLHFGGGKQDPRFRTKLKIASQLVELALERTIPFRAVVADSFYGEDRGFKEALEELGTGNVLALKPSHTWWHRVGEIGSP